MNNHPPHFCVRVAAASDTCVATVRNYFAGRPLRPSTQARIEAACVRLGIALRTEEEAPSGLARSA